MSLSRWSVLFSVLLVCSGMIIVGCGDGGGDSDSDSSPSDPASTNSPPAPASSDQQLLNSTGDIPAGGTLYTETVTSPGYGMIRAVVVTLDSSDVTAYLQNVGGDMSVRHSETTGPDIDMSVAAEPDAQWRIGIDNPNGVEVTVGYSIVYDSD